MQQRPPELGIEAELRTRLTASGASQPEIAEHSGISQSTISRFMRGVVSLSIPKYEALLRFVLKREAMAAAGIPPIPRRGQRAPRGLRGESRGV